MIYFFLTYLQEAKADCSQESTQSSASQNTPRSAVPVVTSGDPEIDKKIKNLKKVRGFYFMNKVFLKERVSEI